MERNQEYVNIIGNHKFFCSVDNEYTKLSCDEQGYQLHENVFDLYDNHDEAVVAFHVHHASENGSKNIVVRCNETDILVILLMNSRYFQNSNVWIDVGLDSEEFVEGILTLPMGVPNWITFLRYPMYMQ